MSIIVVLVLPLLLSSLEFHVPVVDVSHKRSLPLLPAPAQEEQIPLARMAVWQCGVDAAWGFSLTLWHICNVYI